VICSLAAFSLKSTKQLHTLQLLYCTALNPGPQTIMTVQLYLFISTAEVTDWLTLAISDKKTVESQLFKFLVFEIWFITSTTSNCSTLLQKSHCGFKSTGTTLCYKICLLCFCKMRHNIESSISAPIHKAY